ncbi:MAG: polyribonucleotide nucleotidyltransferase [Chitinophagales bacterium]|nr:polyribonucleotide nucleotidyltransferase [Chitinophagaceae bacterium]MBP9883150.1 polyribonucleotide nucleotidyltransferase [Chitinophagales bacterium]
MSKIAISKTFDLGDGKPITIETGKLATQADGAALVRQGNCMILATVVSKDEVKEGQDFFPLSVDYQEKFASAGRIPGGFFRREARLSDYEILISRLVDRALRPLFPEDYLYDTQVIISLISADQSIMPDSLAALAASAALTVSNIPFNGPISEVRVCRIDGKYLVNPSKQDIEKADLDVIVAGSSSSIVMVEGEAKEVAEADLLEAIRIGHEAIRIQCQAQMDLAALCGGKKPFREYEKAPHSQEIKDKVYAAFKDKVYQVAKSGAPKTERKLRFSAIKEELKALVAEWENEADVKLAKKYYSDLEYDVIRNLILDEGIRLDGRKTDEVRAIWTEIDYLPSAHGSAVFTRGETQSLTTVTLGTKLDELMLDKAMELVYTKFILHYNFPPFSTGEVKPNRGPGRREVGHGNLAMRSLKNVLPSGDDNPYTIRVVSDILESNGSSSMATVCAGSLALFDAGLKMKSHVSGIAMGLITREDGKVAILSDILGDEDHLGDMDFKVTGTAKGICGCQMDIKVQGLSFETMFKALEQARQGRLHILNILNETIAAPRADYKPHAPRIIKIMIPREFIGAVIGPGGKVIQEMQRETGTTINISEVGDEGEVLIASANKESIDKALSRIRGIIAVPQPGEIYDAKVKSIMPYGAFVEFLPGKEGLLHISEVSNKRLETLEGVMNVGDIIKVKLLEVDKKTGKFKLSSKALIEQATSN